jgi:hypothetical protein
MPSDQQASPQSPKRRLLIRIPLTIAFALGMGWLCGLAMRADARLTSPPGLFRGMLHGAIMPIAWTTLIVGHDQPIYAERNEGRVYKLGYSLGVNLSGLVFIGGTFVSLGALRRNPSASSAP